MGQLIEFAGNHPYLVSGAVLVLVVLIVSELRTRIQDFAAIGPNDAIRLMNQGGLVIDVRERAQFEAGHIGEARNIQPKDLAGSADQLKKYREKPVIVCCDSGMQGGTAARELAKLGFSKVFNLRGGVGAWRHENLPLVRAGAKETPKAAAKS